MREARRHTVRFTDACWLQFMPNGKLLFCVFAIRRSLHHGVRRELRGVTAFLVISSIQKVRHTFWASMFELSCTSRISVATSHWYPGKTQRSSNGGGEDVRCLVQLLQAASEVRALGRGPASSMWRPSWLMELAQFGARARWPSAVPVDSSCKYRARFDVPH